MKYRTTQKSIIVLIIFLTSYSFANAQIDIKSRVDEDTYSNFSIIINLFEKNIKPNDVVTLFIPINSNSITSYLSSNNIEITKSFLSKHTIKGVHTLQDFNNSLSIASEFELTDINNDKYYVQKNLSSFLISDKITTESNVVKELQLDNKHHIIFIMGALINL